MKFLVVILPGILQILSFGLKSSHTIDVIHSNWSTVPGPFCWSTSSVIFAGSPNVNLELKVNSDKKLCKINKFTLVLDFLV